MNKVQDDEIDLFELFETLWDGKWLISTFVAIAVLLGGGFLLLKEVVYESRLIYTINTIPPFYEDSKVLTDFKQKFYSNSVFEGWKESNSNTSLLFEEFSKTEVIDGFVLSKNEGEQLATLAADKEGASVVLIKSSQLAILDDFFEYSEYINKLLKAQYITRARAELNIIETRFKDFPTANEAIVSQILNIDRYVVSAEKGASVLAIQRPIRPKKVSPKSSLTLTLVISVVLGAMIGLFFALVRNAIAKRKEQLAKS